jgi:shikimate kinase
MRIVLIGPMGSGKSSIGKILAKKIDLKFFDIDKLIEIQEGIKIKEIFNTKGENYFRDMEIEALKETLTVQSAVIATGGGIIQKEVNRLLLKKEKNVFFLNSSVKRQFERTKDSDKRPLLNKGNNLKVLEELYNKRLTHYENVSRYQIEMDDKTNEEVIDKIIKNT